MNYRDLMSGRRVGPLARLQRLGLRLASIPYAAAMRLRNRRYDRAAVSPPGTPGGRIFDCGVPVISIGNLTTGGTGKTPIVCGVARQIRAGGLRVALISRGYGRGDRDQNDEADELAARLPDVPHVQDPDRVEAARIAVEELGAEVILMDDGYQHRRLHRDLNVLVIDATCPLGYGYVLPRGLLREPISGIARASAVVITRCDQVDAGELQRITQMIKRHHPAADLTIVHSEHRPTSLLTYPDQPGPLSDLVGKRVWVLCGIGNPDAFVATVRRIGADVVGTGVLADHAAYDAATVASIRQTIATHTPSPDRIVCTHKDLVKLQTDRLAGIPLCAVLIDWTITAGEREWNTILTRSLTRTTDQSTGDDA